jgi:hypothetical protein
VLKIFGGGKPDHPMADIKEARKILEQIPANDSPKAIEELFHWLESVRTVEGFKLEYRAELVRLIDDAAQVHVRRLSREYLSVARLPKFQEARLWGGIYEFWKQSALAFSACIELQVSGAKGSEALRPLMPLLTARALRGLAAQMKWQYMRYGPFENSLWGAFAKIYALAETGKYAQTAVAPYPNVPGETSAEQEFLRAVMLSASSPDSLLPLEIEIAERLIAHFSASFKLVLDQQPDIAYWIDLATSKPPLRLARPPQHAPTLRFFAAGKAEQDLDRLIRTVKTSNAVPSDVSLGGTYDPQVVLGVLQHLALYWSPKPPARRSPRHSVKSRLKVTHGFDGVLEVLAPEKSLDFDDSLIESWIVENVSVGGFGAAIPQIKGEWLRIGALVGLQPEGGDNWLIGIIRRLGRESPQQGTVGVQTLARNGRTIQLRPEGGLGSAGGSGRAGRGADRGILLDLAAQDAASEVELLLRAGTLVPGQNLEYEQDGKTFLLLPAAVVESGDDYDRVRFRQMMRDTGE